MASGFKGVQRDEKTYAFQEFFLAFHAYATSVSSNGYSKLYPDADVKANAEKAYRLAKQYREFF